MKSFCIFIAILLTASIHFSEFGDVILISADGMVTRGILFRIENSFKATQAPMIDDTVLEKEDLSAD